MEIDHPSPLGTEYFQYDDVGNLVGKKDGNAVITAYEYDDLNRLTKVDYEHGYWPIHPIDTADVTYTYYPGTRLRHEMADSTGTSHYDYDIQDRLTTYTPPSHGAITYAYNNLGQKTSMTNGSQAVGYQYFANGWLKAVTDGTNPYAVHSYDTAGNRIRVDLGNGTYTLYAYDSDPRYRVSSITHTPTVGNPVTISYPSRDSAGNPLTMTIGNTTTTYTYDANSRLTNDTEFAYDWVGNRTTPGSMVYNNADQLTEWPGVHQYEYDGAGNLQFEYDDANPRNLQKTYTYTAAGLLSSVTHAGVQNPSEMTWDGAGRRVTFTSSTDAGNPYTFVYDATSSIPAVIEEAHDGDSAYYVREPGGSLVARISGSGVAQTVSYYHFDELGSTRLLTNGTGVVTDTYSYDAWGQILARTGETEQPYGYVGQSGYYTHVQDANLPLLQLGLRFYASETGRFTQRDAAGSGGNDYAYVSNRPLSYVDPSGLSKLTPNPIADKAKRCATKCVVKCGMDIFGDAAKCFSDCFMTCMAEAFTAGQCEAYFCRLFPDDEFCYNSPPRNPCVRDQTDPINCQQCCGVKWRCCLITTARGGPLAGKACQDKHTACNIDCVAGCGKR